MSSLKVVIGIVSIMTSKTTGILEFMEIAKSLLISNLRTFYLLMPGIISNSHQ